LILIDKFISDSFTNSISLPIKILYSVTIGYFYLNLVTNKKMLGFYWKPKSM